MKQTKHGFTLIQLSVMVLVLGLLAAAMIPAGGNVVEQTGVTAKNVAMIRQAMKAYMLKNGALPCPALAYQQTSVAAYGTAASSGTACDTTNLLNNGNTFIGMVPVKSLALPDDVAFDGFGRKLTYAVDGRATTSAGCMERQALKQKGVLDIRASAAGATESNAMWLLISHGRDGHGSYPAASASGATVASRLNIGAGMTDADTLTNANVNAAFAASVDAIFVNKAATTSFDDSLWIDPQYANTCALGSAWKDGYYLTMEADANHDADTSRTAVGDINGDGYDDIVIGAPAADYNGRSNSGSVYIQFGSGGSFASPTQLLSTGTYPTRIRIDGAAASDAIGANVAVGDVNGDTKADVIISSTAREWVYVLFGRATWASSTNISALVGGTMTDGFRFDGSTGEDENIGTSLAVADVNRDGYGDIIAGAPGSDTDAALAATASNAGAVYVILGKSNASTDWTGIDVSGAIAVTALRLTNDYLKYSHSTASGAFGTVVATGDVNGDGFQDIVASSPVNQGGGGGGGFSFLGTDTTTQGNWPNTYGSDGYYFFDFGYVAASSPPSYASFYAVGGLSATLIDDGFDTGDPRGVCYPSNCSSRLYTELLMDEGNTFSDNPIIIGDGQSHEVSFYFLDPGSEGRTGTIKIWDQTGLILLDSQTIGDTSQGVYFRWRISSSIRFEIVADDIAMFPSLNIILFDPAPGGGSPTYGEVYTIFGKASPTSLATTALTSSSTGFKLVGMEDFGSQVGEALAVGDINADGKDDIIIGAPNSTISSVSNAGIVHVVYGQAFGNAYYNLDNVTRALGGGLGMVTGISDGNRGFYINGTVANQYIGKSLAVTDLNKDGYADIAITGGIDASNQIDTRIIWGKNTATSAFADDNAIGTLINGTSTTNGIILRRTAASLTANHLASGDLNGDRYGDLIIPYTNSTRRSYVVYGRNSTYFTATTNIDNF